MKNENFEEKFRGIAARSAGIELRIGVVDPTVWDRVPKSSRVPMLRRIAESLFECFLGAFYGEEEETTGLEQVPEVRKDDQAGF